jgi:hypothetical protein
MAREDESRGKRKKSASDGSDDDPSERFDEDPRERKKVVRPGGLKPRSIARKRLSRKEMALGKELLPYMEYRRPKTRSECKDGIRPCPFVSCRYHLYVDVNPITGTLKLNFPGMDVELMPFSCALDVADMGGRTLEEVGQILNMTRERVRQLEASALKKLRGEIEPDERDDSEEEPEEEED